MARIRTVKPDLFRHETLFEAEQRTKLPLRLAYIGLFTACDRDGRFKWKPKTLKLDVLPYDEIDFSRVLDALATRGFVVRYASPQGEIGWIPSFTRHQVINNRESDSQLPPPDEETMKTLALSRVPHACRTCDGRGCDACKGEGKGREGNKEGKEGEARFAPPTREELDLAAAKIGLPSVEVDKFVAYFGSNGWMVGRNKMKSWQHALNNWRLRWETERSNRRQPQLIGTVS